MTANVYRERRYLIAACRHYGKSTFAIYLAAQIEQDPGVSWTISYVVQADAADLYRAKGYREATTLKDVRRLMRDGAARIMARPPIHPRELIVFCVRLREVARSRHLTLVIDELVDPQIVRGEVNPELRVEELRTLCAVVRGCNLVAGTQIPASIPMSMRQLTESWYLGRVSHDAALIRLRNVGVPPEILRELPSMGQPPKAPYEFIAWQTD